MSQPSKPAQKVNPWIGAVVVLAVLIALNVVANSVRLRIDATEEKQFTLSPAAEQFLGNLPAPVTLKFYYTRGNEVPMFLKQYQQRVTDLLREIERAGKGKLALELYDPQPDSDEEEWAQRYGLAGQPMGGDAPFYMGLVAVSGQREAALPFLNPNAEAQMEYNIARLVHEVSRAAKPKLGLMSNLPIVGPPPSPMMRGRQNDTSWMIVRELRRYYDVVTVNAESESIPADLTALLVVHPKELKEPTLYAIDQFVMRGGRLVALVDPLSITEREMNNQMSSMTMMMGNASDLNRLTKPWGAELLANQVIADASAASPITFGSGQSERLPSWLSLRAEHINTDDVLTANIRNLMMPFAGGFKLTEVEGVTATPLLNTSDDASTIDAFMAAMPGPEKMRNAAAVGQTPLAVRLHGRFPSAFGDTAPVGASASGVTNAPHLAVAEKDSVVVLVGDVDFVYDQHAFRMMNLMGQTLVEMVNDNFGLIIGIVEQSTGSEALIGLRSRGVRDRAFSRVLALEEAAQQRWQAEELKLTERLQETQQRLNELQMARDDNQQLIISPEQKAELEKFRQVRFETQRELKNVRRNLRQDIEQLGIQVKAVNLAAVPALVALYGIVRGWHRRRA